MHVNGHQPLSDVVPGASAGHETEFIFPPPKAGAPAQRRAERLLLAAILSLAVGLAWAGASIIYAARTFSANLGPGVMVWSGVGLLAMAVAAGVMWWRHRATLAPARLAAENARLVRERDLLRTIIDQLPDCIYAKDQGGRFVLNNRAHAQTFGETQPRTMEGKSDFDYFPRELAEQFYADEQRILRTGESVINQEQYKSAPGDKTAKKYWSLTSKVVWRDQAGGLLGTVGVTRDINEFKLTQEALRRSEERLREFTAQLEQSNRELQDFAYVASHDLQEPLRKIVVFGDRLKEKCAATLGPEPRDYLERMQKAATRMQILINDLLAFSRVTTKAHAFVPVALAEVAHAVVNDLEARIEQVGGRVEIGALPVIEAEGLQMRQLLQNLIGNALKFRRPEVPPVVNVAARLTTDAAGRSWCELTVGDNGIGFDEKYLDRIFTVFQRLHTWGEYEGTGMGLAIVKKIALFHGGDITAKSQPGRGATFIVTLPAAHLRQECNQTNNPP